MKTDLIAELWAINKKNTKWVVVVYGGSYPVIVVLVIAVAITRVEADVVAFTIILTQEEHSMRLMQKIF